MVFLLKTANLVNISRMIKNYIREKNGQVFKNRIYLEHREEFNFVSNKYKLYLLKGKKASNYSSCFVLTNSILPSSVRYAVATKTHMSSYSTLFIITSVCRVKSRKS
jgi:hypothetical protein